MKRVLLVLLLTSVYLISLAQTAKEYIALHPQKAWLSHAVYPVDMITSRAETPKGYTPFYVSHYGRHGSR
ncbi:MAG: histidine-type phosphatase, partial [Alistipes sp.]|nr:histidine-type phosphatase [Candidatus Alistipes equi]